MAHSFQVLPEFKPSKLTEGLVVPVNTTTYFNLNDTSHWDSVYGIWIYIVAHTAGAGNITVTLQGAVSKTQATWTDIGAGVAITGGTLVSPIETPFNRTPVAVAAGTAINTLQPYLRLKLVTDVGCIAYIHSIERTMRGLT